MIKTKHPDLLNAIVDMQKSIAYAARKNVLLMAEAVIVSLEAQNAQLKAELAQAKLSYDGAVAAHHEAKSQYRDLIEAHRRELAGWEAAHVALDRELGEAKAQEARLREALMKTRRELWHCNEQLKYKGFHEGFDVTVALAESAKALEEAGP